MGGLIHHLQHDPSESPRESTATTLIVKPSRYQAGAASSVLIRANWPIYSLYGLMELVVVEDRRSQ